MLNQDSLILRLGDAECVAADAGDDADSCIFVSSCHRIVFSSASFFRLGVLFVTMQSDASVSPAAWCVTVLCATYEIRKSLFLILLRHVTPYLSFHLPKTHCPPSLPPFPLFPSNFTFISSGTPFIDSLPLCHPATLTAYSSGPSSHTGTLR
ncbi:hypothetical protein E2C01_032767 [Portunus trituberculatus]|uniref:Uncharacterized protein n=1 Tax=Portunus trituberculatus TaxID=210409 RepID=A0A5B7F190_PORTR|nr:hypothetical protein [Portunus trituberculatus]